MIGGARKRALKRASFLRYARKHQRAWRAIAIACGSCFRWSRCARPAIAFTKNPKGRGSSRRRVPTERGPLQKKRSMENPTLRKSAIHPHHGFRQRNPWCPRDYDPRVPIPCLVTLRCPTPKSPAIASSRVRRVTETPAIASLGKNKFAGRCSAHADAIVRSAYAHSGACDARAGHDKRACVFTNLEGDVVDLRTEKGRWVRGWLAEHGGVPWCRDER